MNEIKSLLTHDEPVTWLFYGDSITHGALHTWGWRDYTELFAERIRQELARYMDVVINTAISGDTTPGLLAGFDWRAARFKPEAVFLMIGMNDCSANNSVPIDRFEQNLNELADRFAELGTCVVMQTTCPILPDTSPDREPHFDDYMQKVRDVAAARSLPLIDHTAWWRRNEEKLYFWQSNAFHPNEYGHRAFVHLVFRDMGIFDEQSPTCRLFVP